MSELSVMILCGRSPRHLYVANRLSASAKTLAIVQEDGTELTVKKAIARLRPASLTRKAWRWLRERRRYSGDREARFFFGDAKPRLDREDLLVRVPHINHPSVVELAERLQPDLIAVFGTSLIRGPLLRKARIGMFNLHGGLSPDYRGADCTFWALYNGEPHRVGCTLHRIDAGIDTGELVAHICPPVTDGDDEFTLFWRGVSASADAYVELVQRLDRGERLGRPQGAKGRLYQVKERGWRHERKLAAAMRNGLLRGVQLPQRVHWFESV